MPDIKIAGYSVPKPKLRPAVGNLLDKDESTEEKLQPFYDPGGLVPKQF
jgi:hypothetical protein